jgi:predicted nucleic-acid-binding protein
MTGLDTNILVRYLTQDDPAQSQRAAQLLEQTLTEDKPGFVSVVTIAELAWVLRSNYGWGDEKISEAFRYLLLSDNVVVQNQEEVFVAVSAVEMGLVSFGDALIGALGQWAGCSTTFTFDVKASRFDGFMQL